MDMKLVFVLGFLFVAGLATAEPDAFGNENADNQKDETKKSETKEETANDEEPKMEDVEDSQASTPLAPQNDPNDPDYIKHKGFCHWGIAIWFKPGAAVRCSCMKCVCQKGGDWACAYEFSYCPYFYCGNQIYNPATQICCCGKVHSKKANYSCCGYFYYDARYYQCCNYYSVKPKKGKCPRYRI